MKLKINNCDVDFQFEVKGWSGEPDEDRLSKWTKDNLSLKSEYINYNLNNDETLTSGEIAYLCERLGDLLHGRLTEDETIEFIEPDLEFTLHCAKRLYDIPGKVMYRGGYVDVDIDMELTIHFWCSDGLGTNTFTMMFLREEIAAFYAYLSVVIGRIKETNRTVQKHIKSGMIIPE